MPGRSLPPGLASVACTWMLRVASSTIESIAVTRPVNSTPGRLVGRDAHAAADAHLAGRLLRHAEVHVDRIQRLQRHQRVAAGQVLTEVDLADAEHAGERRPDRLPLDRRADFADARVRLAAARRWRGRTRHCEMTRSFEQPLHAARS